MTTETPPRLRNVQFWQAGCDVRMQAAARIEELEENLRAAIDDAKEAEAYAAEMEARLAKAMQVVEMIASSDVDAVLGEAVDLSCEIIGDLMDDEDNG
jgi:F0F1-type ATP synthase assembly protein I